jgi:hypothetical protein
MPSLGGLPQFYRAKDGWAGANVSPPAKPHRVGEMVASTVNTEPMPSHPDQLVANLCGGEDCGITNKGDQM